MRMMGNSVRTDACLQFLSGALRPNPPHAVASTPCLYAMTAVPRLYKWFAYALCASLAHSVLSRNSPGREAGVSQLRVLPRSQVRWHFRLSWGAGAAGLGLRPACRRRSLSEREPAGQRYTSHK